MILCRTHSVLRFFWGARRACKSKSNGYFVICSPPLMLCVECAHPVSRLYTYYSQNNIRATTCTNCHKFADKYIECDSVLVGIDLVLLKPQAIRHVVFNVLAPKLPASRWVRSQTQKMMIVITLSDVYLQWAWSVKSEDPATVHFLSNTAPTVQYLCFLFYASLDTAIIHVVVRQMAYYWLHWTALGTLSTGIMLSTAAKLLPIGTLIWDYNMPIVNSIVWWIFGFVLLEHIAVVLNCGYVKATIIGVIALGIRWLVCSAAWSAVTSLATAIS